jgi:hypothetical protein
LLENFLNYNISNQAAMPAISIGKTVYANQTVLKTYGTFVWAKSIVGIPEFYIIQ